MKAFLNALYHNAIHCDGEDKEGQEKEHTEMNDMSDGGFEDILQPRRNVENQENEPAGNMANDIDMEINEEIMREEALAKLRERQRIMEEEAARRRIQEEQEDQVDPDVAAEFFQDD